MATLLSSCKTNMFFGREGTLEFGLLILCEASPLNSFYIFCLLLFLARVTSAFVSIWKSKLQKVSSLCDRVYMAE